jgi:hypothetical protein
MESTDGIESKEAIDKLKRGLEYAGKGQHGQRLRTLGTGRQSGRQFLRAHLQSGRPARKVAAISMPRSGSTGRQTAFWANPTTISRSQLTASRSDQEPQQAQRTAGRQVTSRTRRFLNLGAYIPIKLRPSGSAAVPIAAPARSFLRRPFMARPSARTMCMHIFHNLRLRCAVQ